FFATLLLAGATFAQKPAQKPNGAGVYSPWTKAETIRTNDLASTLRGGAHPVIFQVGFATLYKSKHVPGAIYAGPASKPEGLEKLREAVAGIPKDREIVIYCGCCPWDHCPNMKPAYALLHRLGYKRIKVIEIPENFAKDWINKGFPVEGGTAGR
ncbi:MAG: rhodanese-like domain-containing protein, partial [Bryobacteraceae bacterium]